MAAFLHLLVVILDGSTTNQEVFFLRHGPATIGALLQKVSPTHHHTITTHTPPHYHHTPSHYHHTPSHYHHTGPSPPTHHHTITTHHHHPHTTTLSPPTHHHTITTHTPPVLVTTHTAPHYHHPDRMAAYSPLRSSIVAVLLLLKSIFVDTSWFQSRGTTKIAAVMIAMQSTPAIKGRYSGLKPNVF